MKNNIEACLEDFRPGSQNNSEKLGVLVVCWHQFELLDRCLSALSQQTSSIHRLVIIDNSSGEPPLELKLPEIAETLYIKLKENVGFAKANNIGVSKLQDCTWIALVNPDAFLAPECLFELMRATVNHPEASSFAAVTLVEADPELLDGAGDVYHASGLCWRRGHGKLAESLSLLEEEIFSPCAAAALYRRNAYEAVGGMDEDYFCYCEDVDLGFRMHLTGHKSFLIPSARALHVGSASTGGQRSDFSLYYGHRNLVWTFVKNMPAAFFWIFLPIHLLMNLAAVLLFTARGKGAVLVRAKRDALLGLPAVWRKRRRIQAVRSIGLGMTLQRLDMSLLIDHRSVPRTSLYQKSSQQRSEAIGSLLRHLAAWWEKKL